MIIKLNHVFKMLNGQSLKDRVSDGTDKEGNPIFKNVGFTFKQACENALLVEKRDPQGRGKPISGSEKVHRYDLAIQIHKAKDEIDLCVDDVKLLKDLIAEIGSPLIVGQAWAILDPPTKK